MWEFVWSWSIWLVVSSPAIAIAILAILPVKPGRENRRYWHTGILALLTLAIGKYQSDQQDKSFAETTDKVNQNLHLSAKLTSQMSNLQKATALIQSHAANQHTFETEFDRAVQGSAANGVGHQIRLEHLQIKNERLIRMTSSPALLIPAALQAHDEELHDDVAEIEKNLTTAVEALKSLPERQNEMKQVQQNLQSFSAAIAQPSKDTVELYQRACAFDEHIVTLRVASANASGELLGGFFDTRRRTAEIWRNVIPRLRELGVEVEDPESEPLAPAPIE